MAEQEQERQTIELKVGDDESIESMIERVVDTALGAAPLVRLVQADGEQVATFDVRHDMIAYWAKRVSMLEVLRAAHPEADFVPKLDPLAVLEYDTERHVAIAAVRAGIESLSNVHDALMACMPASKAYGELGRLRSLLREADPSGRLNALAQLELRRPGHARITLPDAVNGGDHAPA